MPQSPIRKLAQLAYKAEDENVKIYRLNIGQPDLPTLTKAIEALRNVDRTTSEYSSSQGYRFLRFAFMSCLNPGDEIIVPEPAYATT